MSAGPIDRLLDWAVVPGFAATGYRLRSRGWEAAPDLAGRRVLVTGASSGLGAAACELLAEAGAEVHMLVRNRSKGEDVRAGIGERVGDARLRLWECDVSALDSVRAFAAAFLAEGLPLAALVNNAGVMPPERTNSADGFELGFATNVLGPFLLTGLLLPALRAAAPSRVVNVSSGGMYSAKLDAHDPQLERRDYNPPRFYAHAKRCEVILAELWQERLAGTGVTAHSMHPGWADTPGVQDSLPGFHRLMGERGIRVVTTPVGDRYVLEALRREQAILGGEQSGHVICLRGHVTGDGLAAALLLCDAVRGRTLAEAAAVMPRFAQAQENVRVARREVPQVALAEAERLNAELDGDGRVLVRASGTEPLIRVLGEAETEEKALQYCGRIADLVKRELG